jgi:hypothetical protein
MCAATASPCSTSAQRAFPRSGAMPGPQRSRRWHPMSRAPGLKPWALCPLNEPISDFSPSCARSGPARGACRPSSTSRRRRSRIWSPICGPCKGGVSTWRATSRSRSTSRTPPPGGTGPSAFSTRAASRAEPCPCGRSLPVLARIEGRTRLRLGLDRTTSPRHFLLIRKHLHTGELAYHYCWVPPGTPAR